MPLVTRASGQPIRATDVSQFTRWVQGTTKDQNFTPITTSASEYTATLTNEDTSAGLILKGVYGATTAFTFNKTGATFNVPLISTNPTAGVFTAAGDTLYGGVTGAATRLAAGSAFQAYIMNAAGTAPQWSASIQSLLASAGTMIGASGANTPAVIPKGTTAYLELVMAAGATGQTWASGVLANAVTAGDTWYATALNTITRLPRGTTAYMEMVMNAGVTGVTWASGALALIQTQGDLVVGAAANSLTRLALGSASQYLRVNAAGTGVAWETVSASASVEKITSVTLGAATGVVDFTSISTAYSMLQVSIIARSNATSVSDTVQCRLGFGGTVVTSATYDYEFFLGTGTSVSGAGSITQTQMVLGGIAAATAPAGEAGLIDTIIPAYAGTTFNKKYRSTFSVRFDAAAGDQQAGFYAGDIRNTGAIDTLRFLTASGQFITGSTFVLWGWP